MEKLLLNPYDKEYMKMAMLKHEETFREQVYELHRLYQIQKVLMKNAVGGGGGAWNFSSTGKRDNYNIPKRPRRQLCGLDLETDDQTTELELTLGLGLGPTSQYCSSSSRNSSSSRKKENNTNNKIPIGRSDSSATATASLSSSSTDSSHIMINKKRPTDLEYHNQQQRIMMMIRQKDRHNTNNYPPWLFQALSLNTS